MAAILKRNQDLLKRDRIAVDSDGDMVVMKAGNVVVKMTYEDAFWLSQSVRVMAKRAKRFSGDIGRSWRAIAILTDANEGKG